MMRLKGIPTAVDQPDTQTPQMDDGADSNVMDFPDKDVRPPDTELKFPDERSALSQVHDDVAHLDSDHAAKVLNLSGQLKEPPAFIDKNLHDAERAAQSPHDSLFAEIEAKYPGTSQFLKVPENMAVAKDDLHNLSWHEGLINWATGTAQVSKNALEAGALQEELGFTAYNQMNGEIQNTTDIYRPGGFVASSENFSQDPTKRTAQIEARLAEIEKEKPDFTGKMGLVKRGLYGTLSFAPQIAGALAYGAKDAAAGIVAGVGVGAATGSAGLVPGMVAGATTGGLIGAGVGFAAGEMEYNYKLMSGLAYNEMRKLKDVDGNAIPDDVARVSAKATGAAAAGLSLVKLEAVIGPLGKSFVSKFIAETPQKVLDNPATQKAALQTFAKTYAQNWAHFTGSMTAITATNIAGREAAKLSSGQTFEPSGSILGELGESAEDAAITGLFVTGPGAAFGLHKDLAQARKAELAKQFTLALGEVSAENKVKARLPKKYAEFVTQVAKDGPVENIHIPVEALKEYFQSKNIDTETAMGELGVTESYVEANKTGGDVQIPLGTWAEKMAGTEHNAGLADDIKYHPEDLTIREVNQRRAQVEADLKDIESGKGAISASVDEVGKEVEQQLISIGHDPDDARDQALVFKKVIASRAATVGRDPLEFYRKEVNLKIQNAEGADQLPAWPGAEVPRGTGLEDAKKEFNQSPAETGPSVSPLGFYSQLEHEVQKMNFKDMPAKDLMGRIKNLSGVKADEIEHTGLMDWLATKDGKVTKAEVQEFLKNEGVKVEQTVLSESFKSEYESDVATETDWQEPQRDHSNDNDNIEMEMEYYTSDDFWDEERTKELRDELLPDHKDEDGNVDEAALDKAMEDAKQEKAEEYARDSVESDDYGNARYTVTDDATGYKLYGSDEHGWYSPELRDELGYDLNEAKVKLLQHMIAEGAIEGNLADHIKPGDIKWKSGRAAVDPSQKMLTQRANALVKSDGPRLLELSKKRNDYHFDKAGNLKDIYTQAEYDKEVQDDIKNIARDEVKESFNDHTNKKNEVTFSIDHGLINGDITGNDHKGYTLNLYGKKVQTRGGSARSAQDFPLTAKTLEDAKSEAVQVLIDQKKISPEKAAAVEGEVARDVNEPTGRSKYQQYVEPGGENYREVLLTLPAEPGAKTFKSSHFDQKNILAHVRLTDRVDDKGRKTLFVEEIQSDMHQAGREKGYQTEVPQELINESKAAETKVNAAKVDLINAVEKYENLGFDSDNQALRAIYDHEDFRDRWEMDEASNEIADRYRNERLAQDELQSKIDAYEGAVPDAPFKNTEAWSALALKRVIQMAVEQGYEAVAWTPAKTHVDRWGTDNVSWAKKEGGTFDVLDEDGKIHKSFDSKEKAQAELSVIKNTEADHAVLKKQIDKAIDKVRASDPEFYSDMSDTVLRKRAVRDGLITEKDIKDFNRLSELLFHKNIEKYEVKQSEPHWLVGSAEQRGGNADGVNIEELARARGELLERRGEKVTTKEELKKVIADTLGREREDRSLDSLTDSVWKQMQESDSGVKSPRKEGMEFFYDKVLPRKVAPAVLKKLDPNAKVEVGKFDTGENDLSVKPEYSGPEKTADELLEMRGEISATDSRQAKRVADAINEGSSFKDAMEQHGSPGLAEAVGGKFSDLPKKILESWEIPITEAMKDKIKLGQSYFQGKDKTDARGLIQFGDGQTVITLFAKSDRSTFAHESAHLFFELGARISKDPNASEQAKADFQTTLKHLGISSADEIMTEHHETFARSWEAYLMEGKAPSKELAGVFSRMRSWLLDLYKNVTNLGVTVHPEMKAVFDRMLATNEEIEAARADSGLSNEVLSEAAPDAQNRIKDLQAQAKELALNTLLKPKLAELKKERQEFLAGERSRITSEAEQQIRQTPVYQAIDAIKSKVGRKDVVDLAKKLLEDKLNPKQSVFFEVATELYGFADPRDLARQIINDSTNEVYQEKLKALVDLGMAPHENLLSPEEIKIAALNAVHNEHSGELLALESQILSDLTANKEIKAEVSRRKKAEARIESAAAREQATKILDSKTLRDSGNYRVYVTAERNAAVQVAKALARKDYEAAAAAKRQQMLAHHLVSVALENRAEIAKNLKYFKEWGRRGRDLKDMPYAFTRQVDQLLSSFGFIDKRTEDLPGLTLIAEEMRQKGETENEIAYRTGLHDVAGQWKPESIFNFLERINTDYYALHLPDTVLNTSRASYKDVTFSEMRDLRGAAQSLADTGKAYNKFLGSFDTMDIKDAAKETRASIEAVAGGKYREQKAIGSSKSTDFAERMRNIKNLPDAAISNLVNVATLTFVADGGDRNGPMQRNAYFPMKQAELRKLERKQADAAKIKALIEKHYDPKEYVKFGNPKTLFESFRRYIMGERRTWFESFGRFLNKEEQLSIALNWGNEVNRDRVRRGYNVDDAAVMHVINNFLTKNDMQFVQGVWDHLNSYWPEARAHEMRLSGVEPKKVLAARVDTVHGSFAGGYYPIAFDFMKSTDALRSSEALNEAYREMSTAKAHTQQGHLQERVATVSRPVRLSLDVFQDHLDNLIHDLEFREPIIDVSRFLNQRDVKESVENAFGIKAYKSLGDWLKSIASEQNLNLNLTERTFQWFRLKLGLFNLGFKPLAVFYHLPDNSSNAYHDAGGSLLKARTLGQGMVDVTLGRGGLTDNVYSKSTMMKHRFETKDRDVMDMMNKWKTPKGQMLGHAAFYFLHWADKAVSVPLWDAVYQHHVLDVGHERAVSIADAQIVRSLGSGSPVDRAGYQRGSEFQKLLTVHYGWGSVQFNRMWSQGKLAGFEYTKGNLYKANMIVAKAMFFLSMSAAYEVMIKDFYSNKRDDDDEHHIAEHVAHFFAVPFSFAPVVRDLVPLAFGKAAGSRTFDYKMSPVEGAIQNIINTMGHGKQVLLGERDWDQKFTEELFNEGALMVGSPRQINIWVFNFLDWMKDGNFKPQDTMSRRTKH